MEKKSYTHVLFNLINGKQITCGVNEWEEVIKETPKSYYANHFHLIVQKYPKPGSSKADNDLEEVTELIPHHAVVSIRLW